MDASPPPASGWGRVLRPLRPSSEGGTASPKEGRLILRRSGQSRRPASSDRLALVRHDVDLALPQEFGPGIPLITLVGVPVLTLVVIRPPRRRAAHIRPGSALRYK
jgi:hypothetical protein